MTMKLKWQDPPSEPSRADLVAVELIKNSPDWALIAENEPFSMFPWWGSIYRSDIFEVRVKRRPGSPLFGPRDVYARHIGPPQNARPEK